MSTETPPLGQARIDAHTWGARRGSYLAENIQIARDWDATRERSQQKAIGWSNLSGCRAYMGFQLSGEWPTDDVDEWGAMRGTALDGWWKERRRETATARGEEKRYGWDVEVEYGGVKGHIDEVDYDSGVCTDLKTSTLKSLRLFDDPEVLDEKFIQPQGYAAGVIETDRWISSAPAGKMGRPLVRLLVIPVDGTFADWRVYEREFDRDVADRALERYATVQRLLGEGRELPRDKPHHFCVNWCEFFSLCRGGEQDDGDLPEITDPEYATALERYGEAMTRRGEAEREQKLYAPLIRGLRGQARGWRVTTGRPRQPSPVPDLEQIRADYTASDLELPMVTPEPGAGSLYVRRVKE